MLKLTIPAIYRNFIPGNTRNLWKNNFRIRKFQPDKKRANVLLVAMGENPFATRGKVSVKLFFPPFCRVLALHGIGSTFVYGRKSLERELLLSDGVPTIVVNLVNELFDNLDSWEIIGDTLHKTDAVFNSLRIAKVIRDKEETNKILSGSGVSMPRRNIGECKKIFSNARFGTMDEVYVYEDSKNLCRDRYNTEFVDTRVQFENAIYYTAIRLMCIGSIIVQIYVYARNVCENNPSVHGKDTPRNRELLDYLYDRLIEPRLEELHLLAEKIESKLGPGFYGHDLIIDNDSGEILLCETGFKFYTGIFSKRMMGVISNRKFQCGVLDQETYAAYAASNFIKYCAKMKFI